MERHPKGMQRKCREATLGETLGYPGEESRGLYMMGLLKYELGDPLFCVGKSHLGGGSSSEGQKLVKARAETLGDNMLLRFQFRPIVLSMRS